MSRMSGSRESITSHLRLQLVLVAALGVCGVLLFLVWDDSPTNNLAPAEEKIDEVIDASLELDHLVERLDAPARVVLAEGPERVSEVKAAATLSVVGRLSKEEERVLRSDVEETLRDMYYELEQSQNGTERKARYAFMVQQLHAEIEAIEHGSYWVFEDDLEVVLKTMALLQKSNNDLHAPTWPFTRANGSEVHVVFPLIASRHAGLRETRKGHVESVSLRRLISGLNELSYNERKRVLTTVLGRELVEDYVVGPDGLRTRFGTLPPGTSIDVSSYQIHEGKN